jgi:hypothetical protein
MPRVGFEPTVLVFERAKTCLVLTSGHCDQLNAILLKLLETQIFKNQYVSETGYASIIIIIIIIFFFFNGSIDPYSALAVFFISVS